MPRQASSGIDHELGVASAEAHDAALTEAISTLDVTRRWVEALTANPDTTDLGAELGYLVDTGDEVLDLLLAGTSIAAERVRTASFEPLYAAVADSLGVRQSEIVDEIHTTVRFEEVIGWITRLLATLVIPIAAILACFIVVRRQIREAGLKMEARLRAERELGLARGEFIAGISHELRTPLTSIYGFSEYLLENEILDPDEATELLALINKDSAELSRMVDDRTIITVSDNGGGSIPRHRAAPIRPHRPQWRRNTPHGLGLSIERSLAQTMGAEIRFVRAGGWANFEVSFPRKADTPIDVPPAKRTRPKRRGSSSDRVLAGGQ